MRNLTKFWSFALVLAIGFVSGCDYGPIDETESYEEYETMEGELRQSFRGKGEVRKVTAWNYEIEAADLDAEDLDAASPKPSDCSCTCSDAAHQACRDLKDKKGDNLCPPTAHAVDIVGSCKQKGEKCGGTCECLDCYNNIGTKCARLPKAIAGTCEFQF